MKIIKERDVTVVIKTADDYMVKTPIGVFDDINEAIKLFPYLSDHKNIRQCPQCKKWFIKYGKGKNRQKYCSKECSKAYLKVYKNIYNSAWNRDKWLRESNKWRISDNKNNNPEYHQNDAFWGLGESRVGAHRSNDEQKEANIIKKELKRIYSKKRYRR